MKAETIELIKTEIGNLVFDEVFNDSGAGRARFISDKAKGRLQELLTAKEPSCEACKDVLMIPLQYDFCPKCGRRIH